MKENLSPLDDLQLIHSRDDKKTLEENANENFGKDLNVAAIKNWEIFNNYVDKNTQEIFLNDDVTHCDNEINEIITERNSSSMLQLEAIKKIIPEFPCGFYLDAYRDLFGQLNEEWSKPEKNYQQLSLLIYKYDNLERSFNADFKEIAKTHFEPLVKRARADVRMYLVKHFNTIGLDPASAQKILKEKVGIDYPVIFKFDDDKKKDKKIAYGRFFGDRIEVYLNNIDILENNKIDEAHLAGVIIHEIIHGISFDGRGLEVAELFDDENENLHENPYGKKSETNLNEIVIELISLDIMGKYHKDNKPGLLKLNIPEKHFVYGYPDLLEKVFALREKDIKEYDDIKKKLINALLTGDFEEIYSYFSRNEDFKEEIEKIVLGDNYKAKSAS